MKRVYPLGQKQYAFRAIDPFTKEKVIHTASSPNSKTALEKSVARFGKESKTSIKRRVQQTAWSEDYLEMLLFHSEFAFS